MQPLKLFCFAVVVVRPVGSRGKHTGRTTLNRHQHRQLPLIHGAKSLQNSSDGCKKDTPEYQTNKTVKHLSQGRHCVLLQIIRASCPQPVPVEQPSISSRCVHNLALSALHLSAALPQLVSSKQPKYPLASTSEEIDVNWEWPHTLHVDCWQVPRCCSI